MEPDFDFHRVFFGWEERDPSGMPHRAKTEFTAGGGQHAVRHALARLAVVDGVAVATGPGLLGAPFDEHLRTLDGEWPRPWLGARKRCAVLCSLGLFVFMRAADALASVVADVRDGMDVRQHADAAFLLEVESETARRQPPAVANAPLVCERADVAAGLTEDNLCGGAWGVVGRQEDLVSAGAASRTSAFTVEWDKPRGCIDCLAVDGKSRRSGGV